MALQLRSLVRRSSAPVRLVELGLCLSFTLFFLWPYPPASWLLLMLAAVLAYIRLEVALALLPLTFPYYRHLLPLGVGGYPYFYLTELGLLICLGAALLRHVVLPAERQATREWLGQLWQQARPFLPPALLFLVGASLAVLVSPDQHDSLRAYRENVLEPLLYLLLVLRYLRTRADLARAICALILAALVAACTGLVQGIFHLRAYLDNINATDFRINGPFGSPNNLAFLLDRSIPLLLALAFLGTLRQSPQARPAWRNPLRWACLVALVPLVWALYWTDSHGAEIALLLVAFLFFAFEVRNWLVVLVIGGAGVLGIGLFWSRIVALLNSSGHGLISQRLILWKVGLLMIRDHFLLGIGPDSFNALYRPDAPNSYLRQALQGETGVHPPSPTLAHPHNFILDFWISAGLLGEVAVFWLLGAFAAVVARTYRRLRALPQANLLQRLLLGIAGCMVASVIHGLVDNLYFLPDLAMMFWFFIGMVLLLSKITRSESPALHSEAKQGEEAVAA